MYSHGSSAYGQALDAIDRQVQTVQEAAGYVFDTSDTIEVTGVTAGTPGDFTPPGFDPPNLASLKADKVIGDSGTDKPATNWTVGQYVVLGDASEAHWDGFIWSVGRHN